MVALSWSILLLSISPGLLLPEVLSGMRVGLPQLGDQEELHVGESFQLALTINCR
jgi:hypothetical protein